MSPISFLPQLNPSWTGLRLCLLNRRDDKKSPGSQLTMKSFFQEDWWSLEALASSAYRCFKWSSGLGVISCTLESIFVPSGSSRLHVQSRTEYPHTAEIQFDGLPRP